MNAERKLKLLNEVICSARDECRESYDAELGAAIDRWAPKLHPRNSIRLQKYLRMCTDVAVAGFIDGLIEMLKEVDAETPEKETRRLRLVVDNSKSLKKDG